MESTFILLSITVLLLVLLMAPMGYWYHYHYYYIQYLDWEAIDKIFEDPMVYRYFKQWGPIEREVKTMAPFKVTCPTQAIEWFKRWIRNFSNTERLVLDLAVNYLRGQGHPHRDWKFVKIHSLLEFGYPFTLGEYIFLPHQHLKAAVDAMTKLKCVSKKEFTEVIDRQPHKTGKHEETLRKFVYYLVHERVHVHQRYNQKKYDELYRDLGFKKVSKKNIVLDSWTRTHRVTNPDGCIDSMWFVKINDKWYMPTLVLEHRRHKPKSVLIHVVQTDQGHWSPIVYLGKVVYYSINDLPEYVHRFYLKNGLYDPNEIVAYLAADLIMGYKIEATKDNAKVLAFVRKNKII